MSAPDVRTIGFPGRYIQGPGAISLLPSIVAELGASRVALVADAIVRGKLSASIDESFAAASMTAPRWLEFSGECSVAEIERLVPHAAHHESGPCDVIVALGGGKAIDTAKGIARRLGSRLIIAPTIASNDSPTSRLVVLYDDAHRVAGVELLARNPDVVLVDTTVIAQAPVRFFAAGIGDALSKKFESAQCHLAGGRNFYGTPSLATARLLAQRCYETIVESGAAALDRIATSQQPDEQVERVIEATVLLSGVGFESGGLSLAHALVRGFSPHPVIGRFLHGEMVAFGTLVQLVAEGRSSDELVAHAKLTKRLGLPVTFAWFDGAAPTAAELVEMARATCAAPYISNLRPATGVDGVVAALRRADEIGRGIDPRAD